MKPANGLQYTPTELAALDTDSRVRLRDLLCDQLESDRKSVAARRWAAEALAVLAKVGGVAASAGPGDWLKLPKGTREAPRSVEDRANDARRFLRPGVPDDVAERAASARAFLHPDTDPDVAQRAESARQALGMSPDSAHEARRQAAREFHSPGTSSAEQAQRWANAVALCGDERSARQRGYKPPEVV